jgi:transcriptional regulator with XRE-family HTH domain
MKNRINLDGVASRMRTIRSEKKLSVAEMASQLGVCPNDYRKYERAVYSPPLHIQVQLAQKFGISLDWFILNKSPMYSDEIETALRENEQRKQEGQQKPVKRVEIEEKTTRESAAPPDAMIVTAPEIKDLLRFMEENPLYKFQLLTHFYRYKQEGQKAGEISFEDNRQKKEIEAG